MAAGNTVAAMARNQLLWVEYTIFMMAPDHTQLPSRCEATRAAGAGS
jgi:hypothetical protein